MTLPDLLDPGPTLRPPRLEIPHAIDAHAVATLRRQGGQFGVAPAAFPVDCRGVQSVDPVGAALLWLWCREIEQTTGSRVQLLRMPLPVAIKLRTHPLAEYLVLDEELFEDPFQVPGPSAR